MAIDRRKPLPPRPQQPAHQVKLAPVPRGWPADAAKLRNLTDFLGTLSDDQGRYKDVSLRRLTSMHIEFKDNGLVVRLARADEGSINLTHVVEEPRGTCDAPEIPSDTNSKD